MAQEREPHDTLISLVKTPSAEVEGGADLTLKLRVSCPSGCELWGKRVELFGEGGVLLGEVALTSFGGGANETEEFSLKAPFEPGSYTWRVRFPSQEKKGIWHKEGSTSFSFTVKPHTLRLSVWDVPSMVVTGEGFTVKVGAECSSGCNLMGQGIRVYDHQGKEAGAGGLGGACPQEANLYLTELKLEAPMTEGRYWWKAYLPQPSVGIPHREVTTSFAFTATRAPEVTLTIMAIDQATQMPAEGAEVTIRPFLYQGFHYSSRTDDKGEAGVNLPKGRYQVSVLKPGRQALIPSIEVVDNMTLKTELRPIPWEYFY